MKAWIVSDKNSYEGYSTIVFAETVGKARSIAMTTAACEDSKFIDIIVTRIAIADKMYRKGKKEMDFDNFEDRIFMVRDCGFYCIEKHEESCEKCEAKKYCIWFTNQ